MDDFPYGDTDPDLRLLTWEEQRVFKTMAMGLKEDTQQMGLSMLERYTKLPHTGAPLFPPLPHTANPLTQPGSTNGGLSLGGAEGLLQPPSHAVTATPQQQGAPPPTQPSAPSSAKTGAAGTSSTTTTSVITTTTSTTTTTANGSKSTSKRKRKSPKKVGNKAATPPKSDAPPVDMAPMYYTMPTPAPKQDTVYCSVCKIGFSNWQCLKLHAKVHERHNFGMDKLAQQFAAHPDSDDNHEPNLSVNIDAAPVTEPELKVIMGPVTTPATNKNGQNAPYSLSNKIYVMSDGRQFQVNGPPYKCLVCGKEYRKGHELHEHLRIHTGEKPYACPVCDKTFRLRRSLRDHSVVHTGEKRFKCRQCGKAFRSKDQRWNHESLHTGDRPYKCDRCGSAFRYPALLRQHKKHYCRVRKQENADNNSTEPQPVNTQGEEEKSSSGPEEEDDLGPLNQGRFFPGFPTYSNFSTNPLLTTAASKVPTSVGFKPDTLGFPLGGSLPGGAATSMTGEYSLFDGMRNLQTVTSLASSGGAAGTSTSTAGAPDMSAVKVEAGSAPMLPPIAASTVASKQIVSVQVMNPDPGVTGSNDHKCFKSHICSICGKIFRTPSKLRQHVYQHTGETPYPCPHCERAFKQKKRLIEHVRIHTGEKPYMCRYCGRAYRVRGELRKHEHTHTGVRPHVCDECGQAFTWKKSLRTHRLIHTNERPHVCEVCGASFRHRVSLRNHRRHHEKGQFFSAEQVAKISSRGRKNKPPGLGVLNTSAEDVGVDNQADDGADGANSAGDLSFSSGDGESGQDVDARSAGEPGNATVSSAGATAPAPGGIRSTSVQQNPKTENQGAGTQQPQQQQAVSRNISCPICNASFGRQDELYFHLQFHQLSMDGFPGVPGPPPRAMSTPSAQQSYPGYLEGRGTSQFDPLVGAANHPSSVAGRLGRLDNFGSVFPHPVPISGNGMGAGESYSGKYKGDGIGCYPYMALPLDNKANSGDGGQAQQAQQRSNNAALGNAFNFHHVPNQPPSPAVRQIADSHVATPTPPGGFNVFPTPFAIPTMGGPMGGGGMGFPYSRPLPLASPMNLSMTTAAAIASQSSHMASAAAAQQLSHFRNSVGSPGPQQNMNTSSPTMQQFT